MTVELIAEVENPFAKHISPAIYQAQHFSITLADSNGLPDSLNALPDN